MGEIMFNYTVDNTSIKHESMFKYWYDMSKEQNFAYQRFVALSDASTFNKPVAITKVATGFIDLHQLFVIQDGHSMLIQEQNWIRTGEGIEPQMSNPVFAQNIDELSKPLPDKFYTRYKLGINRPFEEKLYTRHRLGIMDFEKTLFGNYGDIVVNTEYKNLFGNYENDIVNIKKDSMGKRKDLIWSKWDTVYMGSGEDNIASPEYQTAMTYRYIPKSNFFSSVVTNRNPRQRITNFIKDAFVDKIKAHSNFYKYMYGYLQNKPVNIKQDIAAASSERKSNINNETHAFRPIPYTNIFEYYHADAYNKYVYEYKKVFSFKGNPRANYNNMYKSVKHGLQAQIDSENVMSKDISEMHKNETLSLSTGGNNGDLIPEILVFTFGKTSGYLSLDSFGIAPNRVLNVIDIESVSNGNDAIAYIPGWFGSHYDGKKTDATSQLFAEDNGKYLLKTNTFLGSSDGGHTGSFVPYHFSISDYGRKARDFYTEGLMAYKSNNDFNPIVSGIFTDKERVGMYVMHDEDNVSIQKTKKSMTIGDDGIHKSVWTHKQKVAIPNPYKDTWIDKYSAKIHSACDNVFIYKIPYLVGIQSSATDAKLEQKYINIFNQGVDVIKKYFLVSVDDDIDTVIKSSLDVSFYGASGYDALIIPVSKVKKQSFIDRIDDMVGKEAKPVYITRQSFASVVPKPFGTPNLDLFCDKKAHESYINYKNIFITKSKVHFIMFSDDFVSKVSKDIAVYTQPQSLYKTSMPMFTLKDFSSKKIEKDAYIHEDFNLIQLPHKVYLYDSLFIDKIPTLCYYYYGHIISKEKYDMTIQQQDIVHKITNNINVFDLTEAIRPIRELYRNEIFHAEVLREMSNPGNELYAEVPKEIPNPLYNEMQKVHAIYKELNILPNDFGNWAWVYEDPDPFEKPAYEIDELLLPENDTRYEDFKDIMFDKKQLKPKNPVKKIDDTTFIGKYPTKHPLPNYDDVGVVYLDVRTEIIHEIFLKFYRIWQSRLFEFSTMTMTQAVSKMLEYLYSWIMLYWPEDKIEEALRVLRQIRWYGEMAIIQNSQYIISYEYEDLKSKLHTGTCAIPNDIDPDADGNVANPTMIVDSVNAVIRNNPDYIGVSDARVRFTVNIKRNTTFSFSLINTIGSVKIYIDNVLVGTESFSKLNLTYPLNYTGKPTNIDIIKTRESNLNNMFCIGNIIVANGTFKDLSIEFDPALKAGNKPLDEIAKKMIQYANEHDDVTAAYEHVLKTNVGVSETYKKMLEYWKIHHVDKTKGKRLTIKQV